MAHAQVLCTMRLCFGQRSPVSVQRMQSQGTVRKGRRCRRHEILKLRKSKLMLALSSDAAVSTGMLHSLQLIQTMALILMRRINKRRP